MIIICKECSTKFRLDESLLEETGSQVRCSVCKNIFSAYPPQVLGKPGQTQIISAQQGYFDSEEELGPGGVGGFQKEAPDEDDDGLELDVDDDEDMDAEGLDIGDDDTGFDDDMGLGNDTMAGIDTDSDMDFDEDLGSDMPGMDFDDDSEGETGEFELETDINTNLDQGENLDLDAQPDIKTDSVEPETGSASESVIDETESDDDDPDFEFEFDLDEEESDLDDPIEDDSIDIDETATPSEQDDTKTSVEDEEEFELSLYDDDDIDDEINDIDDEMETEVASSEDTDRYESMELEIDEDETDDAGYEIEEFDEDDEEYEDDDIIDEEFEDDDEFAAVPKPKKSGKKIGKPVKILLVVFILLLIGYGAFTLTGGFTKSFNMPKINFSILKNLLNFSQMEEIPVWATINNQSLNGRYVTNEKSGQLFVVSGEITNESSIPLNNIEVEGILISKGGVVAKKKRVFCGNKIPEEQLSKTSIGAINRTLQRKDGEQGSNLNIQAKKSVPFMVVFSNLPKELENYTVTVTSFDRMPKK